MCSRIVHRSLSQPGVVDVRGIRHWWFVAVDQHTDFSVIAPCPSHESQAVAKKYFQTLDSVCRTLRHDGVRRRAGPGSLRDFYRKTLGVRDSGANHSSFFSVAEGSSRAKGRRHQGSGGQDDFSQVTGGSAMSVVSYEVAHALNQRAGRLGVLPATRVFGRSFLIRRWWKKETSWQHVSSFEHPCEKLWKNMLLQKRSGEQLLRVPGQ